MRAFDASGHCRSHTQSLVRFAEVVISEIQRNRSLKVFQFLAESVSQAGKTAAVHPEGVILLLSKPDWLRKALLSASGTGNTSS